MNSYLAQRENHATYNKRFRRTLYILLPSFSLSLCCTAINSPIHIYHLVRRKIGINFYDREDGSDIASKKWMVAFQIYSFVGVSAKLSESGGGSTQYVL